METCSSTRRRWHKSCHFYTQREQRFPRASHWSPASSADTPARVRSMTSRRRPGLTASPRRKRSSTAICISQQPAVHREVRGRSSLRSIWLLPLCFPLLPALDRDGRQRITAAQRIDSTICSAAKCTSCVFRAPLCRCMRHDRLRHKRVLAGSHGRRWSLPR